MTKVPIMFLCVLLSISMNAQRTYTDEEVLRYARALDVVTLDPTLSHVHLEDWLSSGPPRLGTMRWDLSPNCGEKASIVDRALPLCVAISYERSNVNGTVMVQVGTVDKGPYGPASLKYALVHPQNEKIGAKDESYSETTTELAKFPRLLDDVSYTADHKDIVALAKGLNVATLDSTLSPEQLDDWLRSGPPHLTRLMWGVSLECNPSSAEATRSVVGSARCVKVSFARPGVSGWATIIVPDSGKSQKDLPQLGSIFVQSMSKQGRVNRTSNKLSDLPRLLDQF